MNPIREQYVVDANGTKTAVILSIEQYEQLLEDLHDLAIVAERRPEKSLNWRLMQVIDYPSNV